MFSGLESTVTWSHAYHACTMCQAAAKKTALFPLKMWSWPAKKCEALSSCTTEVTIESVDQTFATHGIPDFIVSDNGTCFTSATSQDFLKVNEIKHFVHI